MKIIIIDTNFLLAISQFKMTGAKTSKKVDLRFKCKVCHEDIFLMRQGTNDVNMQKIIQGEYCGKCHNGKIAWAPIYCDRCHSGPSSIVIPEARGFVK